MFGGELFGLEFAGGAGGADEDDLGAEGAGGFDLDLGRVVGHDDDGLRAEGACGVGDALGVIA